MFSLFDTATIREAQAHNDGLMGLHREYRYWRDVMCGHHVRSSSYRRTQLQVIEVLAHIRLLEAAIRE